MSEEKVKAIYEKGFDMSALAEYKKNILGGRDIENMSINLDSSLMGLSAKSDKNSAYSILQKANIYRWIIEKDYNALRYASRTFYDLNGVYKRACDYAAYLYRYDWYIAAEPKDGNKKTQNDKLLEEFNKLLRYLDNSYIKQLCGEIALNIILDGVYYAYIVPNPESLIL